MNHRIVSPTTAQSRAEQQKAQEEADAIKQRQALDRALAAIESFVLLTPSGDVRNHACDISMSLRRLEEKL